MKARENVHKLGLKNIQEWREYCGSEKKPNFIPSGPEKKYKKDWTNYGHWLGTNTVANKNRDFLPFQEARGFVSKLGLNSQVEWFKHAKSGKLLLDIPITPNIVYENEWGDWGDWGDWLGTGRKATQQLGWSIQKVKELIKNLIKNKIIDEWSDDERYHLLLEGSIKFRFTKSFFKTFR